MRIGDPEQGTAGSFPGVDQRADVGVALGDDACERRHDALERFELPQTLQIGTRRLARRRLGGCIACAFIGVLLRDRLRREQPLPAHVGGARQLVVGLRRAEVGLRLVQLLIDLGSLDVGQELALFHAGPDVGVPDLQVAVGACVDRGLVEGLYIAGQHQLVGGGSRLRFGR